MKIVKKKVILLVVGLVFYLLVLSLQINFVSAGSVGISPAKFDFFFEPNLEKTFTFTVYNSDSEKGVQLYVKGDLSEYVEVSKMTFEKYGGKFDVTIRLPNKIDKPGKHRILIGAAEYVNESEIRNSMVGGIVAIQVPIDIYVPYPGKYAEAKFVVDDIEQGEDLKFNLIIDNLGTEDISVNPFIEVFQDNNKSENKIYDKTLELEHILSKESLTYKGVLEGSDFTSGKYFAIANINYGDLLRIQDEFRVGQLLVNITDYSYQFESEKINRFNIGVENLWNSKLEDVYAQVRVTNQGNKIDDFTTSSVSLAPWEKTNLTGFFDASNIEKGKYVANINVVYKNITTHKLVTIYVNNLANGFKWFGWMIAGVIMFSVFIILVIAIIIYLIVKVKKLSQIIRIKKKKK